MRIEAVGRDKLATQRKKEQPNREGDGAFMPGENNFYQHSGRSGISVPLILLVGLPISAFFAVLYVTTLVYSVNRFPALGYLSILFLAVYVLATGFALAALAKLGRARSAPTLFLLGCLAGLIGLYFSWLFFFKADYGAEFPFDMMIDVARSPSTLWGLICETNASGWWVGGPSGILQWCVSAAEAIAFVLGIGVLTSGSIDRHVFCESCKRWLKPKQIRPLRYTEEIAEKLEASDQEELGLDHADILRLPEATAEEIPRFDAEILECPSCSTSAVRLTLYVHEETDEGEMAVEEIDLPGILLQKTQSAAQGS